MELFSNDPCTFVFSTLKAKGGDGNDSILDTFELDSTRQFNGELAEVLYGTMEGCVGKRQFIRKVFGHV
jgi:hypothetical protein